MSNSELFNLIKTLSGNEKRHFKLSMEKYASVDGKNYMRLFSFLEGLEKYDEQEIKEHFKGELLAKNLNAEKHNLYKMILKNLNDAQSEKSVSEKIRDHIAYAKILLRKNLTNAFQKELRKAKKLAYKYEDWTSLLPIITLERKLIRDGVLLELLSDKQKEEDEILDKLVLEYALRKINSKVDDTIQKSVIRDKSILRSLEELLNDPLLTADSKKYTYAAARYKHSTISNVCRAIGRKDLNYQTCLEHEQLYMRYPQMIKERTSVYLSHLTNLIIACAEFDKEEDAFIYLEKLKAITNLHKKRFSKADYDHNMLAYYGLFLELARHYKKITEASLLIPEVEVWLKSSKEHLDKRNIGVLYLAIVNILFINGRYAEALKWDEEIINDPIFKRTRDDIQTYARILNVIIHFKLGHRNKVPQLIKSSFSFIIRKKKLYKIELCLMSFVKKRLRKNLAERKLKRAFEDLKLELDEILKDPTERRVIDFFDFPAWLESEISGKTMKYIIDSR